LRVTVNTMLRLDERLLESKMTEIERARSWSPRIISKFETLIRNGDDLSLYRVNPLGIRARSPKGRPSTSFFMRLDVGCST
jgi:hypothetical protein